MKTRHTLHSLLLIVLCLFANQAIPENLPSLGSQHTLEQSQEGQAISEAFLYELYPHMVHDPELSYYLQTLGNRLVLSAPQLQDPLRFHLLLDPNINAFAVPGGFIGVYAGLFLLADTESELAGVMAHEIAHIAQKHYQRSKEEMAKVVMMNTAAMLAAIQLATQSSDPSVDNLGSAIIAGSIALTTDKLLQFSRSHEEEADRVGMDILVNSGFDPQGMPDFFAHLAQSSQYYAKVPEFMSTHPVTESRLSDTRSRAVNRARSGLANDSLQFQLMKAKLRVLLDGDKNDFEQTLQHEQQAANELEKVALKYALAQLYLKQGDYKSSLEKITQLRKQHPDQISIMLLEAEYYLQRYRNTTDRHQQGQYQKKIAYIYSILLEKYPENYPIVASYAEYLLQTGQYHEARQILRNHLAQRTEPESAELYTQLAGAEWNLGNTAAYMEAMAQYNFWKGDIDGAIRQLKLVLKRDDLTPLQRNRLADMLKRYKDHARQRQAVLSQ